MYSRMLKAVSWMPEHEKKGWNQGHIWVPGCCEVLIQASPSRVYKSVWFFDFAFLTFQVWLTGLGSMTRWGATLFIRSEGCGDAKAPREWHAEGQKTAEKTRRLVIICHRMQNIFTLQLWYFVGVLETESKAKRPQNRSRRSREDSELSRTAGQVKSETESRASGKVLGMTARYVGPPEAPELSLYQCARLLPTSYVPIILITCFL